MNSITIGRTIIGIDPGLKGGICVLDSSRPYIYEVLPMPVLGKEINSQAIRELIMIHHPEIVAIERQQSFPGQGISSTFVTGDNYGFLKGIVAGTGFSYEIIHARRWQGEMLKGLPKGDKTKTSAAIMAIRLWPGQSWYASKRCTKVHDGMIDAALIAEYARRKRMMGILE